jgi:hypothetical protein
VTREPGDRGTQVQFTGQTPCSDLNIYMYLILPAAVRSLKFVQSGERKVQLLPTPELSAIGEHEAELPRPDL